MNRSASRFGNSRGAVIVWVTILMVVLLAFAGLAVDLGFVLVTRNELQNISDATSLAGARVLGLDYEALSYEQQQTYVADAEAIYAAVEDVANRNRAGGIGITINPEDVTIGRWDTDAKVLTPTLNQANAVRVVARRDESANDPLPTFFARFFGEETASVSALGTAALTPQSTAGEGGLPVPLGISRAWFTDAVPCDQPIRFYPTNDPSSCAGWHVYNQWPASNATMRDTIRNLEAGTYFSPEVTAGVTEFSFTNGTLSSGPNGTFEAMRSLYEARRDPITGEWVAAVPIYDRDDCGASNQRITIVGFATIVITGVQEAPTHQIDGYVICNNTEPGRGGGANFGTMGSIPGLVQ